MIRTKLWTLAGLCLLGTVACQELVPTSVDDDLLPPAPVTVEVRLGWDAFGSGLQVLGGYGAPQELGSGVTARLFAGTLNARTLARFTGFPQAATVQDSAGNTRADSALTFVGGWVVARVDTLSSVADGPVTLRLGALQQAWHARTATWELAVDTINDRASWGEAGGGPVVDLGEAVWDPAAGDSVRFPVDSAQVAAWADTLDLTRGVRLDAVTEGARLRITNVFLRLDTRSSLAPDTTLVLTAPRRDLTFVYDPLPDPPPDGLRVGGAPSWRSVMDISVPATLSGPPSLCTVGCPFALTADRLNYAALVLRTRASSPAFQPTDTVTLDLRPVLLRSALPKAPLGSSLTASLGRRVAPDLFGSRPGAEIEIPLTQFVRDLLRGETATGTDPPNTLALLTTFEPLSIAFASFWGPGSGADLEPVLKLIVTAGPSVQLP
ncbi:MAG: hypothetical protein RH859_09935 [Longimicrobiales bacterium]